MASSQISGSVSLARRNYASKIFDFANQLLSFGERRFTELPAQRTYDILGKSLRIAFAAPEYAKLCDRSYLPSRLRMDRDRPVALAILDNVSAPDMPRWVGASPGMGNVTIALAERGLRGAYDPDHLIWYVYDPDRAFGIQAMPSFELRPPWEASFPLRLLLHWAGRSIDRGMVHAGTLGHGGDGVFLAGTGGSGKSGTTLSGVLNGLSTAGDDYVSVRSTGDCVEARPVLRLAKQDLRGLQRLGIDGGSEIFDGPNWQGKFEFDVERLVPGSRAQQLTMKAILIPHLSKAPLSSFRPATGREAMMALAPSSLYQLYGSWKEDFSLIASIVRALPAHHLELSEDAVEIADAIRAFIEGGAG